MKNLRKLFILSILTLSFASLALFGIGEDKKDVDTDKGTVKAKTIEECEAPGWAKTIGHEQQWKLHNGCPSTEDKKEEASK